MKKLSSIYLGILCLLFSFASTMVGQLTGIYYIGTTGTRPGGGDPDYLTFRSAIDALNTQAIIGNVTMYFTSDLTEPSACQLGVNPGSFSITFKPYSTVTSVTLTLNKNVNLAGNAWFGMLVIGSKDTTNAGSLTSTNNVTIDGSKTVGGTTRDLTIATTANITSAYPIRIAGTCNNISVKNCVLVNNGYTGGSSSYVVRISAKYTASAADSVPTNVTIQNNYIVNVGGTAGHGILVDGVSTQATFSSGVVIRDNLIVARTRGIMLNYSGSTDIFKNTIRVKQTSPGLLSYAVFGFNVGGGLSSVINIYNNVIDSLQTGQLTAAGSYGIVGIWCGSPATWNVYNNMISNFYTTATADPNLQNVFGIYASLGTANIYHNTISMNQLAYTLGATGRPQTYAGIYISAATVTAKNNIIVCSQNGDSSYAIYCTAGVPTADYNDLYQANAAGYVGFISATAQQSLANWQSASSQDAHSANVTVAFTSPSDLHLNPASLPNYSLIGTPLSTPYNVDIDGDARNATYPYMGADENLANPLPVELTSFTAIAKGNRIELQWVTATEVNNYGFDVERKAVNTEWAKVGFVEGKGTTSAPQNYSFRENLASSGKYAYRLKQIDRNGKFSYSNEVEAVVGLAPEEYTLAQNYPNPFNPSTTIRFALKTSGHASLKVFNTAGQEVKALFDEVAEAGRMYSVVFDGTGLASGTYFYILQTPDKREVKKMLMMK